MCDGQACVPCAQSLWINQATECSHLLGLEEADVVPQLSIGAVLAVGHQVDVAGLLGSDGVCLSLHLIGPASGNKAHHLQGRN